MNDTIKYKGCTINIVQDEHASSPSEMGNDDMFLIYDHRDFCVKAKDFDNMETFEIWKKGGKQSKYFPAWALKDGTICLSRTDKYHIFAVIAYIHSGVHLSLESSFSCNSIRWDTSFKGFALVKQVKGWSWTRDKAEEKARLLIEEWNQYLIGDVWEYNVLNESEDVIESCGEYYGNEGVKDAIEEAKGHIDYYIKEKTEKHVKNRKEQIKLKIPMQYRKELI